MGCTGAINDLVENGRRRDPDTITPPGDSGGDMPFKLSPGSVSATSSTIHMRATITPTMQQMTSSSVRAQMSLHASPTK